MTSLHEDNFDYEEKQQEAELSQTTKNKKRRFRNVRICLGTGCKATFSGKGAFQRAREHEALTSHITQKRGNETITE